MIQKATLLIGLLITTFLTAQNIKSPSEFLGYDIGTQFTRHSDAVRYFEHVAQNSPLVDYQEYGKTNERRPLTYAIVTSKANHRNLEGIRKANLAQIGIENKNTLPPTTEHTNVKAEKAIVWFSYNIHGNEASGTEASMTTLYELITTKQAWLENTVVIIEPCVNPDGRDRYVNWFTQVASTPYDPKQVATEHKEPWPGGRSNHYLFDLNRDWAWASQVETQARLKIYNKWMPHVHVDFHEQGINDPYYFAPATEPYHEIISEWQRDFQDQIGRNNATYFDKEGWLFFTKERFDLLYPSYGDTYPMCMGAIGMTYEQAGHGRAGLGINTDEGHELTLIDRIAHHTTAGLSTIEISSKNEKSLNSNFKRYFKDHNFKYKSYVLSGNEDKIRELAKFLNRHEIDYSFDYKGKASGYHYATNTQGSIDYEFAIIVSTNQPKGKMVKVFFEPDVKLSTPVTYDITAWSLPYAYGLDAIASTSLIVSSSNLTTHKSIELPSTAAAYVSSWNSMRDAQFLAALLKKGIKVRFTEKPLVNNKRAFDRGSLIITKSDNRTNNSFNETVVQLAKEYQRDVMATNTTYSTSGPDFGSAEIKLINTPSIALLRGNNTSSLSYGTTWHYFEQVLKYPVTSIEADHLANIQLDAFDILIMPSGYYGSILNDSTMDKLKSFVRSGGKVIALNNALNSFADKDGFNLKRNKPKDDDAQEEPEKTPSPYAERENENIPYLLTGSIFKTQVDPTHPMAFGYGDTYHTLKIGSASYSYLERGYNVAYINDTITKVSGFVGDTAKEKLANSMVFGEERLGRGSMIYMIDNPLFRDFWHNGELFMANAIFFINNNAFRN